uniref:VWFA domain-containing protein n=1 Tax=Globodera pallida TaxID=36090 RepID=A0A183CRY9_GLOPA
MLPFCREFAKQMGVTRSGNHLALVQFSGYCRTEFGLTGYFNPERLEEAISMVRYMNGGTRLGQALDYTLKRVMNASRKGPPTTVNKAVVVVTDGASEDDVASPAKALRNDNVQIVVVGVGSGIVQEQLELVADGPANVYTVEDFAQLNKALAGRLKAKICEK